MKNAALGVIGFCYIAGWFLCDLCHSLWCTFVLGHSVEQQMRDILADNEDL